MPDLERFCKVIHDSDVAVAAITDYFSLDGYFAVKEKYTELYPEDDTLLLPNLELRLPVSVNKAGQEINLHLIFRPTLTPTEATRFLDRLNTEGTTGHNRTRVPCADLESKEDFESATVSIAAIDEAIKGTFGDHAVVPSARQEHLLVVVSAKGDGIRPPKRSGVQRKYLLTDEIDKFSDAVFANSGSRNHFLNVHRLETDEPIAPKPVFDGCDAHSFADLCGGLGKHVTDQGRQRNITWIKADPTYAGLLQTLAEPTDRVTMQATVPDHKEPYKVISKVKFSGTDDFPAEVSLNKNLNAIIGSRSSGKSSLLAYIAHAVDPKETVRLQVEAHGLSDAREAGPAAGHTWDAVSDVNCEVEWESGESTQGKVIYIPQNSLYRLSEQPGEITNKIAPALFRLYPSLKTAYGSATSKVGAANTKIKRAIDEWFDLADRVEALSQEIKDLGDQAAITDERDRLQTEIDRIQAAASLTDQEVDEYQAVAARLDGKETRLRESDLELGQLSSYVSLAEGATAAAILPETVQATVTVHPSAAEVPESVFRRIEQLKSGAVKDLVAKIESDLIAAATALDAERTALRADLAAIKRDNAALIAKHEANEEFSSVVADHKRQVSKLDEIAKGQQSLDKLIEEQDAAATKVETGITERGQALSILVNAFNAKERSLPTLKFGIEIDVPTELVDYATTGFNLRSTNAYIKNKGDLVSYEDAQSDPKAFLHDVRDGKVKLNKKYEPSVVAADVLTVTKEVRFSAELDADRIGGFKKSSMTPGKQALFALTLILNESQEPWPLLIDQPEDDLDSRSIYDTIVPYLVERKKERQIIMVSHNANLVIGADSEQVIVANRHGDDRKNKDSRIFDYFTGALEHSGPLNESSATALGRCGVREHACEILDGGEEAFQKRRNKYNI
ncbi:hypothetical protein RE421_16195 (plasmid) [Citricoccus sp. I39-566]|nr:hypothetical protein [Citricoccus sp. I39-566]WMY79937.1 hypothetical protein RE421_16195 [Citricoccus sp. I39-566]